jgi:hypothetical protein
MEELSVREHALDLSALSLAALSIMALPDAELMMYRYV